MGGIVLLEMILTVGFIYLVFGVLPARLKRNKNSKPIERKSYKVEDDLIDETMKDFERSSDFKKWRDI